MSRLLARLRRRVFGISPAEATVARRGFQCSDDSIRARLEKIGATFLQGYHSALDLEPDDIGVRLNDVEAEWRGFAFEGASMGLALRDSLLPWGARRLPSFIAGPGADHVYLVYVGVGWAIARLPVRPEPAMQRLPAAPDVQFDYDSRSQPRSMLRWLAIDGYGFHAGYFGGPRFFDGGGDRQTKPRRLNGYAARVFDQGLGRSLWFVEGANVEGIARTVAAFPQSRQADLWSGIGLACAYAGGLDASGIQQLCIKARAFRPNMAQGASFAAKARQRAGNVVPATELACQVICGVSVATAANITDVSLRDLPVEGDVPAYEFWRRRIAASYASEVTAT